MDYDEDFVRGADHTSSRWPSTETERRVQRPHSAIKPVAAVGLNTPTFVLNNIRPSWPDQASTTILPRRKRYDDVFSWHPADELIGIENVRQLAFSGHPCHGREPKRVTRSEI
jgi:hypothetical protein